MLFLIIILGCFTSSYTQEELVEKLYQVKCSSKRSGSQPECWDVKDWEIFCQRIVCKEVDHERRR
jgi:hypothetical protein